MICTNKNTTHFCWLLLLPETKSFYLNQLMDSRKDCIYQLFLCARLGTIHILRQQKELVGGFKKLQLLLKFSTVMLTVIKLLC